MTDALSRGEVWVYACRVTRFGSFLGVCLSQYSRLPCPDLSMRDFQHKSTIGRLQTVCQVLGCSFIGHAGACGAFRGNERDQRLVLHEG